MKKEHITETKKLKCESNIHLSKMCIQFREILNYLEIDDIPLKKKLPIRYQAFLHEQFKEDRINSPARTILSSKYAFPYMSLKDVSNPYMNSVSTFKIALMIPWPYVDPELIFTFCNMFFPGSNIQCTNGQIISVFSKLRHADSNDDVIVKYGPLFRCSNKHCHITRGIRVVI